MHSKHGSGLVLRKQSPVGEFACYWHLSLSNTGENSILTILLQDWALISIICMPIIQILFITIKFLLLQFLEGLHSLVPDSLLALFDENELELLICGVRDYKLSELKRNHDVVANGLSGRTISWFWLALDHFTQGDESCCYSNYVCSTGR